MENENIDFLTLPAATGDTEFSPLEPDLYKAVCVGIVTKDMPVYQHPEQVESKYFFVFQVSADDKLYYLKSRPLRNVMGDKSKMYELLHAWTGKELADLQNWNMGALLGKPVRIMTDLETKGDKTYAVITTYARPKKDDNVGVIPDDKAPAYLIKNVTNQAWVKGISFAAEEAPAEAQPASDPTIEDVLTKGLPMPAKAPKAKVPTNPAKAAPAPANDDDEGLPF